jgi:hypothetical protein
LGGQRGGDHRRDLPVEGMVPGAQLGPRGVGARLQVVYARTPIWCQAVVFAAVLTTIDLLGPAGIAPFIYFRF